MPRISNWILKEALQEAREKADENGYFSVEGDIATRVIFTELKRLGHVKQISDWTGFDSFPTAFSLESKAYFCDDDDETENIEKMNTTMKGSNDGMTKSNRIFIVHGHDNEAKVKTENFIRKIGLEPVVLSDQANGGKTIIEKLEAYTDVGYAIVLYTPCDETKDGKFRARQNVVLEHGYLMGRLGRKRVAVLYKADIEMPSDVSGVAYIPMCENKEWELNLVKELQAAGYNADANKL